MHCLLVSSTFLDQSGHYRHHEHESERNRGFSQTVSDVAVRHVWEIQIGAGLVMNFETEKSGNRFQDHSMMWRLGKETEKSLLSQSLAKSPSDL